MTEFRASILSGDNLVGHFISIPHPVAVEVVAGSRPDFVCIDWEHAQIARDRIEEMVRAADVHGIPAVVRVPGHASEWIAAALDAGAAGVLVPRIENADQARAAIMATRYPPVGSRGVGPGRAAGYGYRIADYIADANKRLLLAIQIETKDALSNLDEIFSVSEIDIVFIGPGDLAVSLGAMGPEGSAQLDAAIDAIVSAALNANKKVGCFSATAQQAAARRSRGMSFAIVGSDASLLSDAVREVARMTASTRGQNRPEASAL